MKGKINSDLYTYYFDCFFNDMKCCKQFWEGHRIVNFEDIESSVEYHFRMIEQDNRTLTGEDFQTNDSLLSNYEKWWSKNKQVIRELQAENK